MAWGNTWGDLAASQALEDILKPFKPEPEPSGVAINAVWQAAQAFHARNNKVPTHDPYTNPNAFIYYSCECGQVLDPGTKSFAALNNAASVAGWKIRWGDNSYIPYCVECGKGIE